MTGLLRGGTSEAELGLEEAIGREGADDGIFVVCHCHNFETIQRRHGR